MQNRFTTSGEPGYSCRPTFDKKSVCIFCTCAESLFTNTTVKMSLDCQTKDRLERSCHLTLKQYNIILSYLNTGIKPPTEALEEADLVTALNGGINKCGKYHRLRSLASRLSLRPTDGALVFASNGKVVIPSSKFVQIIKQAHKSGGEKHLNVTQTLAKVVRL